MNSDSIIAQGRQSPNRCVGFVCGPAVDLAKRMSSRIIPAEHNRSIQRAPSGARFYVLGSNLAHWEEKVALRLFRRSTEEQQADEQRIHDSLEDPQHVWPPWQHLPGQ